VSGYKATVTVTFIVTIGWGTQSQLEHENGHLLILQDYLNGRTPYYSQTYEQVYSRKKAYEDSTKAIENDFGQRLSED